MPSLDETLGKIQALTQGWYDGADGETISPVLIASVKQTITKLLTKHSIPIPYLYPIVEGGARAEWSWGNWEVSTDLNSGEPLNIHATLLSGAQTRDTVVENWTADDSTTSISDFLHDLMSVMI